MSRTTSLRTSVIASSANLAVYTAGEPIYAPVGVSGHLAKRVAVLPAPGQWVFYNPATGLSTGEAATHDTVPLLKIGVAIDDNGDGASDYIRWFNDGISGCSLRDHDAKPSECGVASIADVFFGCAECGQTYTIEVQVYDPITEAFGSKSLGYIYHFSYTLPCGDCTTGDCIDDVANADEIMCGLYNKIKGVENDPNWDIRLNNFPLPRDHEFRFDVSKLFDGTAADFSDNTTFEYCFEQTDSDCEDCDIFNSVGGYNLTGDGEGDVLFDIPTFTAEGEVFTSNRAQLELAIVQLNEALGGNGNAIFIPAVGNCCANNKIEINTCLLDFQLLDGDGAPIEPCGVSNPFLELTRYSECQDCDSEDGVITQRAGLRFYSKPFEGECQCLPGNKAHVEYYSEIEAYPVKGFAANGGAWSAVRQRATLPKGQGFQWQARELNTLRNAFTKPFVDMNFGGKYGYPEDNDRLLQSTVNCKDHYCVVSATVQSKTRHDVTGETSHVPQTIYALIPSDHATAQTSFETAWNLYFSGHECGLLSITCAED